MSRRQQREEYVPPVSQEDMIQQAIIHGALTKMFGGENGLSDHIPVQELVNSGLLDRTVLQQQGATERLAMQGQQRNALATLQGQLALSRLDKAGAQKMALAQLMNDAKENARMQSVADARDTFEFQRKLDREDAALARQDAWEQKRYEAFLAQEAADRQYANQLNVNALSDKDAARRAQDAADLQLTNQAYAKADQLAVEQAKFEHLQKLAALDLTKQILALDPEKRREALQFLPKDNYMRQEEAARQAAIPDQAMDAMQNLVGTLYSVNKNNPKTLSTRLTELRAPTELTKQLQAYLPATVHDYITPDVAQQAFNSIGWDELNASLTPKDPNEALW